jgi:hypothetical protein
MKSKKCLVLVILGVCVVLVGWYIAVAGEPSNNPSESSLPRTILSNSRDVLSELKGVYVLVEVLAPEIEKNGLLTSERIRTDVELELRKFSIKVLSREESLRGSGCPCLYISSALFVNSYGRFSGAIDVELNEQVLLIRRPGVLVIGAATWQNIGAVQNGEPQQVRDEIKGYVDKFINEYLAANPKEPAATKDANDSK